MPLSRKLTKQIKNSEQPDSRNEEIVSRIYAKYSDSSVFCPGDDQTTESMPTVTPEEVAQYRANAERVKASTGIPVPNYEVDEDFIRLFNA